MIPCKKCGGDVSKVTKFCNGCDEFPSPEKCTCGHLKGNHFDGSLDFPKGCIICTCEEFKEAEDGN